MTRASLSRDGAVLGALIVAFVGVTLGLAIRAGAVGVPHNDDWVYMLGADNLFRSGALSMPGHSASSVGQMYLVQPFLWVAGGNAWAYTAFGLAMAAIGIAATYALARMFLGLGASVMVVLLVALFPGFARQSASFMTDGPAFALETLSLLLGVVWLRSRSRAALGGSLLVGVLAVSIREFAVVAPTAVLVVSVAGARPSKRGWWLAVVALAALAVAALLFALRSSAIGVGLGAADPKRIFQLASLLTTLAAVVLPAIVLAVGRRLGTPRTTQTLTPGHTLTAAQVIAGVVLVGLALATSSLGPIVGNLWMPDGIGGGYFLSGTRPAALSPIVWSMSEDLAILAAMLGAALAIAWGQALQVGAGAGEGEPLRDRARALLARPTAVLLLFLVGYAVTLAYAAWRLSAFDRYVYPMVPPAAILLLRWAGPVWPLGRAQAVAYASLLWLGVSAVMLTANSFAYDSARWKAGEAAVAMGYGAATVDAGYEWVGYHSNLNANAKPAGYGFTRYDDRIMASKPCAVVSNRPLKVTGYVLLRVERAAYRQYLVIGTREPLYLYGATGAGCPTPAGSAG